MTLDDERDRELDAFLRRSVERISPAPGTWESISRRANRRKRLKATMSVAAGLIVLAGAVPAVIAVRHDSSNQTVVSTAQHPTLKAKGPTTAASAPTSGATTAAPSPQATGPTNGPSVVANPALKGFSPTSVTFVTSAEGWSYGPSPTSDTGVVAKTLDQGASWSVLAAPPIAATAADGSGDFGIRFADGATGYVFGAKTYASIDGAQSWVPTNLPGQTQDIEIRAGAVWAVSRSCATCDTARLYHSVVPVRDVGKRRSETFTAVKGVPALSNPDSVNGATQSISVNDGSVFVMVGTSDLYYSKTDGKSWSSSPNPCVSGTSAAAVASWSATRVAVACTGTASAGIEAKTIWLSHDDGTHWRSLPPVPERGALTSLSLGATGNLLVGVAKGDGYVTYDSGQHWANTKTGGVNLGFVGFIGKTDVVAVSSPSDPGQSFLTSNDGGQQWSEHSFAN